MTNIQAPINKTYFKQWNIFIVLEGGTKTMYNEDGSTWEKPIAFTLKKIPMTDLRKYAGYESFADKANTLYKNYSVKAYEKFYNEFQAYCDELKLQYNMQHKYNTYEYMVKAQAKEAMLHYGEVPQWVKNLSDNQHKILLERARVKYDLEPEYIQLEVKEFYRVPQQLIKDYNKYGEPEYYTAEELAKTSFEVNTYNEVIGKFKFYSDALNKVAEQAVIRDAKEYRKYDGTKYDLRNTVEIPDASDFEERMAEATAYILKNIPKQKVNKPDARKNYVIKVLHALSNMLPERIESYPNTSSIFSKKTVYYDYTNCIADIDYTYSDFITYLKDTVNHETKKEFITLYNKLLDTPLSVYKHTAYIADINTIKSLAKEYLILLKDNKTDIINDKDIMPAEELVATALYLYNIQPDEYNKNTMKPINCIEDTYLGRDEEFVDFQCDIYGLDKNGDLFSSHKKFQWGSED